MASVVKSYKCGTINTSYTTTNKHYVIKFISEVRTLQNIMIIYGQIITAGVLVFKTQYPCSVKYRTNWYCEKHPLQQDSIVPTHTILHSHLDIVVITYVQDIPKRL